jgi:hypothetical protein
MTWTREQKLQALLRLPWTFTVERNEPGRYWVARVVEVPSAIATADNERQLSREAWASLQASLEVYLDNDDDVPLPPGIQRVPWEAGPRLTPRVSTVVRKLQPGEAWQSTDTTAGTSSRIVPKAFEFVPPAAAGK